LEDKVRVRKNPRYWDATNTLAQIIDILPITSPSTAFNLYEQGRADVVWDKNLVPAELLDVLFGRADVHKFDYLGTAFIRFNVTRKPFDDPRVRRALGMAVDRQRLVDKITRGGEHITTSLVPAGTAHYTPVPGLDYNPDAARKLLAEAGYPGGKGFPRFEYLGNTSKLSVDVGVELQEMWHDNLGLDVELHSLEWKVYLSSEQHLDYAVAGAAWIGDYNDPQTFLGMFTSGDGNNETGWKNPAYDNLIHQAGEQPDLAARAKIFQSAETMLVREEAPIVPVYNFVGVNFYHTNRIQGIYPNLLDDHPLRAVHRIAPPH
jgi:oligopeptide transport system substrate-binding protein